MLSSDLIKGLRRCNPNLIIPEPDSWHVWYPGKDFGMTSIWLDVPKQFADPKCRPRKICSFHLGMVPEFTQTSPQGIIRRGWRSIFDKAIKSKCVSKRKIEHVFKVSLDRDGRDNVCPVCRREGTISQSDGKSKYCLTHRQAKEAAAHAKAYREEVAYLVRRSA